MLRGHRIYSDEDITVLMGEALSAFGAVEEAHGIPEDLRQEVFRCCHILVSTREQTGPLRGAPGFELPGGTVH